MRLLVVSDLHYALPQYEWLIGAAPDFDAVIIAGDQLDMVSPIPIADQVATIGTYIARIRRTTPVIVCSGNHDLDAELDGERQAQWVRRLPDVLRDDQSAVFDGLLFSVCGWWEGPMGRRAIAAQLKRDAERIENGWIWVFHAPPARSPTSWTGTRSFGDGDLTGWIEGYQPDMVFSGHVHQAPFAAGGSWAARLGRTWVFNPGHQFGAPPAHIVVDTDTSEARWFSAAGRKVVNLGSPLAQIRADRTVPDPA